MKFKQFMEMYDNWNGTTKVNDDNLGTIVVDHTLKIMECIPTLNGVENYEKLFEMEVVAFGFYDDELCVRVRKSDDFTGNFIRRKIKSAMEDMLQMNCVCDYTFVQNKEEIYHENMYALDAYMMAYDMAKNGNVECYITHNGVKAYRPVFTVIDGVVTLSGTRIA